MKLHGFTPLWYLLAALLALLSQRSDACGDEYQEPEQIKLTIPAI